VHHFRAATGLAPVLDGGALLPLQAAPDHLHVAALDDGAHRRHAVRVGHDDVGLVVDDEQRVGRVDDVLVDRDAVEVLLEDGAQGGVLAAQPVGERVASASVKPLSTAPGGPPV